MPSWKRRMQLTAANLFSIPEDAILDVPRFTCVDGKSMVIENVTELLHVSETEVRANLGTYRIEVSGTAFQVNLVAGGEVHLSGEVDSIRFLRSGGARK